MSIYTFKSCVFFFKWPTIYTNIHTKPSELIKELRRSLLKCLRTAVGSGTVKLEEGRDVCMGEEERGRDETATRGRREGREEAMGRRGRR